MNARRQLVARSVVWAAAMLGWAGCVDAGQDAVVFPLHVAGTANSGVTTTGGVSVTLDRAELAFGRSISAPG